MTSLLKFFVYAMFRPDGSPCYIGKGKRGRMESLAGRNRHLLNMMKKYGELPKLKIREGLTELEAFSVEVALIAAIGRAPNGPLVNLTDGGEGASGAIASAAKRTAISIAHMGRKHTVKSRANMRAAHLGKTASPETRARMKASCQPAGKRSPHSAESHARQGQTLRGRKHSVEHRAKIGAASRGRKVSPETLVKKRAAALGKTHSAETRARISALRTGTKASDETRAKMRAAQQRLREAKVRRELDI